MFFSDFQIPSTYYCIDSYKKLVWLHKELFDSEEFVFDIETNYPTTNSNVRVSGWKASKAQELICGVGYAWGRKAVTTMLELGHQLPVGNPTASVVGGCQCAVLINPAEG